MTNLEIIKYLATNNPTRLAELLDDIYCNAWNCGSCAASTGKMMEECEIDDFNEWLNEDAEKRGYYYDYELEEWSKAINPTLTIEACYDNLTVTIPVGDPDHMWNKNNEYSYKLETVETAIDEVKRLDTLVKSEEIPDSVYREFRLQACCHCSDHNCMRSELEIYDCPKFEGYYEV